MTAPKALTDLVAGTGVSAAHAEQFLSILTDVLGFSQVAGQLTHRARFTPEGGLAVSLINATGADSQKGALVAASTATAGACQLAGQYDCMGVMYDRDVPDGDPTWIVVAGLADVLVIDTTAATKGYWAGASATAGRADITNAMPPGLIDAHFGEIGHCVADAAAGTDVLARIVMHFN
jgi:hypothetical protein